MRPVTADAAVKRHLHDAYGLAGELEIARIAEGLAANHCISSGGKRWLFKVFPSEYTPQRIEVAARLVQFLAAQGYPAAEFVASRCGDRVTRFENHAAILLPWIDGTTTPAGTISEGRAIGEIGALCGRFHRLAQAFPDAEALKIKDRYTSVPRSLEKLANLARQASNAGDAELLAAIAMRRSILTDLGPELATSQQSSISSVIHGDYFCNHVVSQANRSVGVIDIVGEHYFVGWEMMRCFFLSVPPLGQLSDHDLTQLWADYSTRYLAEFTLSPAQIAIALDAYLLQLTASTFGLIPRQADDDESTRGLRSFGHWRTETARQLASRHAFVRRMMARG
jgi:hypothetical protein